MGITGTGSAMRPAIPLPSGSSIPMSTYKFDSMLSTDQTIRFQRCSRLGPSPEANLIILHLPFFLYAPKSLISVPRAKKILNVAYLEYNSAPKIRFTPGKTRFRRAESRNLVSFPAIIVSKILYYKEASRISL